MTEPRYDVVIAGAGPAGAATAYRLARAGLRVVAVDRAEFPRDKACSEYMSPEGVRHLAALGVLARVEREGGQPIRGTTVHAPRGSSLTGLFARAGTPFRPTGLSVPRRILDHALFDAARDAGAELLQRTTVLGVLRDGAGVSGLVVRDGRGLPRELRGRLTVGADGLRSSVARAIGSPRSGSLRRYALVAHVAGVSGLRDTAELHVGARGYVGLNPLGGDVANVALVLPQELVRGARGRVRQFFFEQLARFPGVRNRVPPSGMVRELLVTGPFAAWSARVATAGALLVGDAADFFDPFTGEGICAALRGAELIETTVLEPLSRPQTLSVAALRPYVRARRRAFLGKWAIERAIGYAMLAPALFDRAVARLERHGLAHTLIGVTGDFVPPSAVLNPAFLSRVMF
ncbi:MAG TPA: FAD-dependent oxidoreductase [Gemmatimonadales bacterium]|nr:FAD-dependent oxidoreductase [Gemmatimonadales bacterium]